MLLYRVEHVYCFAFRRFVPGRRFFIRMIFSHPGCCLDCHHRFVGVFLPYGFNGEEGYVGKPKPGLASHFRLVLGFGCPVNFQPSCTKTEHGIPFLLPVLSRRFRFRCFCEETFHRVLATCTGPVLKFPAVIA